jgi:RHS repeat-associated protein
MKRAACIAFLCLVPCLVGASARAQSTDAVVNWSQGVVFEYDGSGNVRKIGTDSYAYDTAQRLIRGSVAGSEQSYTYDAFGNRTACQSGTGGTAGDCQWGFAIDSKTNRVASLTYDARGNLQKLPEGNTLEYDELGMLRKETGTGRAVYYIYTADDERIAVYDADTALNQHNWRWTIRGIDKKPLREFTSDGTAGTANFKWLRDQVWRDGALLASRQLDSTATGGVSTYHYHVDHLGTPRQVTNSAAAIIGRHDYLPFGPENTANGNPSEPQLENLKFTGHERDFVRDRPPLDYMHARYYEGRLGRFLSVDPTWESADLGRPQSWNRYAYVLNNPVGYTDPDGRCGDVLTCALWGLSTGSRVGNLPGAAIGIVGGAILGYGITHPDEVAALGNHMGGGSGGERFAENWIRQNNAKHMAENANNANHMAENANNSTKPALPKPPRGTGSVPSGDRDPKRKFSPQEREAKRDAQGGQCANGCGQTIDQSNSNGHHIDRHADGGKTEDKNHAEVCIDCHKELHSPPM